MSPRKIVIGILLGTAIAAGVFTASQLQQPSEPVHALVLPVHNPLPEFSLLDQNGNAVTAETFRGQWDLMFFGFTHCPDICPATLQVLASAKRQLAESGEKTLPRIVLVSVDPERDTPEKIGEYVTYFGEGNLGVTGDIEELRKLTSALGIYFQKGPVENDGYNVDHSAAVLLVNPQAQFHALFSGTHPAQHYVADLPLIME